MMMLTVTFWYFANAPKNYYMLVAGKMRSAKKKQTENNTFLIPKLSGCKEPLLNKMQNSMPLQYITAKLKPKYLSVCFNMNFLRDKTS